MEGGREAREHFRARPPAFRVHSFVRASLSPSHRPRPRACWPPLGSPLSFSQSIPFQNFSEVYRVIKGNNCNAGANLERGCWREGNKTTDTPTVPANQSNLSQLLCLSSTDYIQYSELLNWLLEGEQPGSVRVRGLTGLVIKRPPCVVTCNSHPVSLNQHSKYSTFCIARGRGAGTHYKIQSPSESWMV